MPVTPSRGYNRHAGTQGLVTIDIELLVLGPRLGTPRSHLSFDTIKIQILVRQPRKSGWIKTTVPHGES
jgi:hypothetical protein